KEKEKAKQRDEKNKVGKQHESNPKDASGRRRRVGTDVERGRDKRRRENSSDRSRRAPDYGRIYKIGAREGREKEKAKHRVEERIERDIKDRFIKKKKKG
ncbi:unnamed protein product, partial [Ixodes pacificus]